MINYINKIGLGTVQFGLNYGVSNCEGKTNSEEVFEILKVASSSGIDLIDTASSYGVSENVLGSQETDLFKVVSKFSISDTSDFQHCLDKSLENLKKRNLYGYLVHNAAELIAKPEAWDTLLRWRGMGLVQKIGYSVYLPKDLEHLLKLNLVPDLIQIPYNIFDRRFEPYFRDLRERNIEIHTRSSFLQGLFFLEPQGLDSFFDPIKSHLLEIKSNYQNDNELSGYLLQFCVENEFVSKVIIGVNNARQLQENLEGLKANKFQIYSSYYNIDEKFLLPYLWPK